MGDANAGGTAPQPGTKSLDAERNPFYVKAARAKWWVGGGLLVALLIYVLLQVWCEYKLRQAIRQADGLSKILASSTLYPQKDGENLASTAKVNALAIAVWLAELRVVPADQEIEQILEEGGQYSTLIAAIRFGGHCNDKRGELQPLAMPSVSRLVEIGAFFATDCATSSGASITPRIRSDLVEKIAAGGQSGGDLFKHVLTAHSVFDTLVEPERWRPPGSAQLQSTLDAAKASAKEAQAVLNDPKRAAEHQKFKENLAAANRLEKEAEESLANIRKTMRAESEEREGAYEARRVVYGLGALRDKGEKSPSGDSKMRAVQAFATALVASIEADPDVASWRRWLAAVTGYEQFFILALFLITGGLMIDRHLVFKDHRRDVVDMIGECEKKALSVPAEQQASDTDHEKRQKRRELQASTALTRANGLEDMDRERKAGQSEIVIDMNKAARSDLSQIHLYGISDQRVDKMAESLKDKIESSRQLVEWGVTTLPALGFLGTVRGILIALSAVGGLSQGDSVARLGALLDVSGALGIAFATTLLALVCMIILSYVDIRQARSEKALIDGLRDFLNDRVLP